MKENKYLSKEYTNCIRGICAIIVVIHHLYQYTDLPVGPYIGKILSLIGALAVSVFFFYSGYGLMLSSKKENYVRNFMRNKFLPLYCFYIILVLLYSLWTLLLERTIPLKDLIQSFLYGSTIVTNGWYLQATFIFYLIYFFSFSIFKTKKSQISSVAIAIGVFCIFCRIIALPAFLYQTMPCVVLGMLYCDKKALIDTLLNKHAYKLFILSAVSFLAFYISFGLYLKEPILNTISFLFFVIATISLSYILCDTKIINNFFFTLCGKYSLAIYVSHGLFLRLIKLNIINNKLLYVFTVIVGTVIMSVVLEYVYTKVITLLFKKKNIKQKQLTSNESDEVVLK